MNGASGLLLDPARVLEDWLVAAQNLNDNLRVLYDVEKPLSVQVGVVAAAWGGWTKRRRRVVRGTALNTDSGMVLRYGLYL